mmetsp:Transcript_4935/g.17881  ORF Transcript_4935/g.17881 Transcript_4935/m.17881 type:complete len:213 (-) Transcript_4935:638-1276(-)
MLKELVLVRDEDAADEADNEEEGEAERPEDVHDEVGAEGMGGKRARHEGQVKDRQELGAVGKEDSRRSRMRDGNASSSLVEEIPGLVVEGAVHVVVEGHEEAEVGVNAGVMEGVEGGRVDKILEPREHAERPYRKELEVAMPDHVEEIKPEEVEVEHRDACSSCQPCSDQRDREVGGVHEMLHEGMDGPRDCLCDEGGVMVRVILGVERVNV